MQAEEVKKNPETGKKHAMITIRVTKQLKQWINQKNYSPTLIFRTAVKELGYEVKQK